MPQNTQRMLEDSRLPIKEAGREENKWELIP
jgi:hypothetical protein